jgi:hypothetical protein
MYVEVLRSLTPEEAQLTAAQRADRLFDQVIKQLGPRDGAVASVLADRLRAWAFTVSLR